MYLWRSHVLLMGEKNIMYTNKHKKSRLDDGA